MSGARGHPPIARNATVAVGRVASDAVNVRERSHRRQTEWGDLSSE